MLLSIIDGSLSSLFKRNESAEAFSKVYKYLHDLCRELHLDPNERLVVVPGNHDFRVKGLFSQPVQSTDFYSKFKDRFRPVFLPALGICVFVMDSNVLEKGPNLATGSVEKNDLLDFFDFVQQLRTDKANEWNSFTKIVLLHHHPMPIAATEGRGFFALHVNN